MKKMLASLAVLTMTGSVVSPILATVYKINSKHSNQTNNDKDDYKPFQSQEDWESYMNNNKTFTESIKALNNIPDNYIYQNSNIALATIKVDNIDQPIGTLLMNGKIQTTVGTPNMASQHIIDNSQGSNPITVNYDSKTVTNTSIVSATFSNSFSASIGATATFGLPWENASISTTLSYNTSQSNSSTSSVQETITFDKFSTTVKPGDKEEVDYVVMQNKQVFNMVLKAKLDLSKCIFNFVNKNDSKDVRKILWSDLANNSQQNQLFAKGTSNSVNSEEIKNNLQPLIKFNHINNPNIPVEQQDYDTNTTYFYLPLSFNVDGYSTLITQSKL